ncbi:DUF4238 domain-containing protein [Vibrio gigantis]|uniref:DUF4238 domain-containing protein n=1 Tax=Vibrio gigantis TaxID=296199 RepID=A0A5M9P5Y8_9VIBR|nr:DUF4238 domain-containing protein [Vibrio gigantis]KAA8681608.1 DUF4238 domain-containing protein [Vibrio gigantis]
MASNKNQHYVPQCYLRRFSSDDNRASINLMNIDRAKFVPNAPIKGQCSKNYFYGKDLRLEKALQPIENNLARVLDSVASKGYELTKEDSQFLLHYWILQQQRTEATSKRYVEMTGEIADAAKVPAQEFKIEMEQAVQDSIAMFLEVRGYLDDLKICLVKNETDIEFITSDDPAVQASRLNMLTLRQTGRGFGLGSSGLFVALPLTPKIQFIAYDSDIYQIPSSKGWVRARQVQDIKFFNQLQILNCRANLFVSCSSQQVHLSNLLKSSLKNRPQSKFKINYLVLDESDVGQEVYRVVDRQEFQNHSKGMIHQELHYPSPSIWASFLRLKARKLAYSNGSAMGLIRAMHARMHPDSDFKKAKL